MLTVQKFRNIHKLWLQTYPDKYDVSSLFSKSFKDGFDSLRNFEQWGMHKELARYDAVLEPWDHRSYDRWRELEEDDLYLNCEEWLQDKDIYIRLDEQID